jgi:ATP-binding cassette subfamily C protein
MKRFFEDAALMPNQVLVVALSLAAGLSQAFGITLFIPLFQIMLGENAPDNRIMQVMDRAFAAIGIEPSLPILLLVITLFIVGGISINYFRRVILFKSMLLYVEDARDRLIQGYLHANWSYLSQRATGVTLNQLLVQTFRAGTAIMQQTYAISDFIQITVLLGASALISLPLFLCTIVLGVLAVLALVPFRKRALVIGTAQVRAEERHSFYVVDYLKSLRLIKSTGTEDRIFGAIRTLQDDLHDAIMKKQDNLAKMEVVSQALPTLILSVILLFGYSLPGADLTQILVFGMLLVRSAPLLVRLQQLYQTYIQETATIDAVRDAISEISAQSEKETKTLPAFEGLEGDIVLKNLQYRFPSSDGPALDDISITIGFCQMTAIVGRSGAGKSTLLEILCRLRKADSGTFLIDGKPLDGFDIGSWRRHIGYVAQDTVLFNGTIRDNLKIVKPDASEDDFTRVLEAANLSDVIRNTEHGLDTMLGEGGVRFSGGQRQRLALARALMNQPSLLILDEATSDLDPVSEREVQNAIDNLVHKMTIVVVAHRLETIRNADRIYMLNDGRVIADGTYDVLARDNAAFANFHNLQTSGEDIDRAKAKD